MILLNLSESGFETFLFCRIY